MSDPGHDLFGLSWRRPLAAALLARLESLDVIEMLADDLAAAGAAEQRAARMLGEQVPLMLHGVSLGLASTQPVDERRLSRLARVIDRVRPASWSEHLAFVRGGGAEIGHLAQPPRTHAIVEGLARNVERAERVVGAKPALENVATLIDPPGSTLDEANWLPACVAGSGADLLLDLHNLLANGANLGFDPLHVIEALPLHRVSTLHLAGGRWLRARDGSRRLLDDHLHAAPEAVFALLEEVAARSAQPLVVILERDGNFGAVDELFAELGLARAAVARGRARATAGRAA